MAKFDGMALTNAGRRMIAESLSTGTGILVEADGVIIGDGYLPAGATRESMTALVAQKYAATITDRDFQQDGTVIIEARLASDEITAGLFIREIGVIARLEGGGPQLFAYDNAGDAADYLPVGGGSSFVEQTFRICTIIGNAANVTIRLGASAIHLQQIVDAHTATEGQTDFALVKCEYDGALSVVINGAVTFDFSIVGQSTVRLADPLPAGVKVWVTEIRPGGGNG
jgi:hypothetical protein